MTRDDDREDPPLQYRVVEADTAEELERKVNRLLEKGWRLQGGVTTLPTGGPMLTGGYFYQALSRTQ